jgi:hypothetical protein
LGDGRRAVGYGHGEMRELYPERLSEELKARLFCLLSQTCPRRNAHLGAAARAPRLVGGKSVAEFARAGTRGGRRAILFVTITWQKRKSML